MGAVILNSDVYAGSLLTATISGNILSSGSPVIRHVIVYKNKETTAYVDTVSDIDGNWSVNVIGNVNDVFRVVIVGNPGEYSKIFEDVRLT